MNPIPDPNPFGDDACNDVDVLVRVCEGLLVILTNLQHDGHLSRFEAAIVRGADAIVNCVKQRHPQ
jgi:hypothetical protein